MGGRDGGFSTLLGESSAWTVGPPALGSPLTFPHPAPTLPQWKTETECLHPLSRRFRKLMRTKHVALRGCDSGKRGTRVWAGCQGWGRDRTSVTQPVHWLPQGYRSTPLTSHWVPGQFLRKLKGRTGAFHRTKGSFHSFYTPARQGLLGDGATRGPGRGCWLRKSSLSTTNLSWT